MKTVSVSGSLRENVGKKDAKSLRRQDLVPCVVYGGKEQINFTLPIKAFKDLIYTPEPCLIKLEVGGKIVDSVIQDTQFHPVTDKIIHADFLEIKPDKPVKIDIPVRIIGNSPGVIKGGKLVLKLRKLKVQGLMDKLPDFIDIDISQLDIGDSFLVSQLDVKDLAFLNHPASIVVTIKTTRAAATGAAESSDSAEGKDKK